MIEPAMLHKEAIINGLKKHIYDNEMIFYSGWNGYTASHHPLTERLYSRALSQLLGRATSLRTV